MHEPLGVPGSQISRQPRTIAVGQHRQQALLAGSQPPGGQPRARPAGAVLLVLLWRPGASGWGSAGGLGAERHGTALDGESRQGVGVARLWQNGSGNGSRGRERRPPTTAAAGEAAGGKRCVTK